MVPHLMDHMICFISNKCYRSNDFVSFQLNIDMSLTILGLECILLFRLTYSIKRYLTFAAIITNLLVLTCQARLRVRFCFQNWPKWARIKLGTGILVIYNLIDDVAHAGNKDWGGGLTLHMWTCGITFLAFVCQLTGYLVRFEHWLHLNEFH